jgi:dihydrofolate reductase
MGKVVSSISMSLDGFIAGPNDNVEQGLGEGGERLHQWLYNLSSWREPHGLEGGEKNRDAEVLEEGMKNIGASIIGRRMFDLAEKAWGDNPPFHLQVFIVTHHARGKMVKDGGTTFSFVTDGIESALNQAKTAAGDKDVAIGGGANIIQQYLKAGLLDELEIHLVPILLGDGKRLFDHLGTEPMELESTRVIAGNGVTHLRFRPVN